MAGMNKKRRRLYKRFGLHPEGCTFCGAPLDEFKRVHLAILGQFQPARLDDGQPARKLEVRPFVLFTCPAHHDHPWITRCTQNEIRPEHLVMALDGDALDRESEIEEQAVELDAELERLGWGVVDDRPSAERDAEAMEVTRDALSQMLALAITARAERQDGNGSDYTDTLIGVMDRVIDACRQTLEDAEGAA